MTTSKNSAAPVTSQKPKLVIKTLLSPISGESRAVALHHDILIAQGLHGKGVSITPAGSRVVAPCKAKVIDIAPTGHHMTLGASNGVIIEIFIGSEAINTHGVGFTVKVARGDVVIPNQVLVELDLIYLQRQLPSVDVAILVSKGALKLTPYHGNLRAGEDDVLQLIVKGS